MDKPFTNVDGVELARLVYLLADNNLEAAADAWSRLLLHKTDPEDFWALITYPEHTPHCDGFCNAAQVEEHDTGAAMRALQKGF